VARGHFLERLGRRAEASVALTAALALTEEPILRAFLLARLDSLAGDLPPSPDHLC
jgi:predicted RNA polymerase sigma factor